MKRYFFVSILSILLLSAPASAIGLYEGYALADGTITAKDVADSSTTPDNYCKLSYAVTIDGTEYSDETEGFSDFCHLEAEDSVKIKYLVSDPRKNSIASEFEINNIGEGTGSSVIFTILPIVIAIIAVATMVFVITKIIRTSKRADADGDGLTGDAKPATPEQKKLIQEGFRRLGIHHVVKKKLTQAEARETLREINQKLKHNL